MNQGIRTHDGRPWTNLLSPGGSPLQPISSIRTVTVGPGIAPGLLTPARRRTAEAGDPRRALAGLRRPEGSKEPSRQTAYRRWGIAPRPEIIARHEWRTGQLLAVSGASGNACVWMAGAGDIGETACPVRRCANPQALPLQSLQDFFQAPWSGRKNMSGSHLPVRASGDQMASPWRDAHLDWRQRGTLVGFFRAWAGCWPGRFFGRDQLCAWR